MCVCVGGGGGGGSREQDFMIHVSRHSFKEITIEHLQNVKGIDSVSKFCCCLLIQCRGGV